MKGLDAIASPALCPAARLRRGRAQQQQVDAVVAGPAVVAVLVARLRNRGYQSVHSIGGRAQQQQAADVVVAGPAVRVVAVLVDLARLRKRMRKRGRFSGPCVALRELPDDF